MESEKEETLSAVSDELSQRVGLAGMWLVVSSLILWPLIDSILDARVLPIIAYLVVWAIITVVMYTYWRNREKVILQGDVLRIQRGRRLIEIPLRRIRTVELDFPNRRRRVQLLVEPERGVELESYEFVPRGGESGLGGKEVADYLRRRVNEARAVGATE